MIARPALVALALLTLTACSGQSASTGSQDKYAGLDTEIRSWREALLEKRTDCAAAPADKACRAFEVACKGEREITPAETEAGVTAKIASAMTFESWDKVRSEFRPASAFAEFTKGPKGWKRQETGPLNLSTCVAA